MKSGIVGLMDDLNMNFENVVGKHGLGTMNESGELFADL